MPHIPMEYTVDLGNTINVTPLHTLFAMGDDNAHRFAFSVVQGGNPVDFSGCTVLATYTNFTPNGVTVNLEGKIEDGKAVALLSKACYTMEGRFALVVRIKNSVGTSAIFYGDGYMSRTTADTVIDGDYIIYDVNTLIEKIAEINEATDAANKATANANTSAQKANAAADTAITEAGNANKAAAAANTAAENWDSSFAADSAKLGGKSPGEYASAAEVSQLKSEMADYRTAKNLLDNSNFRDFIAQAGVFGQHGTETYVGDRWRAVNLESATASKNGLVMTTSVIAGHMYQVIPVTPGVPHTIAIKGVGNSVQLAAFGQGIDPLYGYIKDELSGIFVLNFTPTKDECMILIYPGHSESGGTATLEWAALYEGTYSAETLPPYVPNGYTAELAECQRYYVPIEDGTGVYGYSCGGGIIYVLVQLPQIMRLKNVSIVRGTTANIIINGSTVPVGNITEKVIRGKQLELQYAANDSIGVRKQFTGWISALGVSADL